MLATILLSLAADGAEESGPWADAGVQGSWSTRLRYYNIEDRLEGFEDRDILNYGELVNRLNLLSGSGSVVVGLQGDMVTLFANRYILDDELYHERALYADTVRSPFPDGLFKLEKVWVEGRGRSFGFVAGDTYASFGRGLSLNLVKNTDIDIDTSVLGGKTTLRSSRFDLTFVAGLTNPQQVTLENPNIDIQPDDHHLLGGLRVDGYGFGPINLGLHGVAYQFARDAQLETVPKLDATAVGGSVEGLGVGGLDIFVEGDYFMYSAEEITVPSGYAVYGSVASYLGPVTILLEGKRNYQAEQVNLFTASSAYELVSGPTLEYERVITEDSSAAVNSNDISGGRVRFDVRTSQKVTLLPYASVGVFRDLDTEGLHFNVTPETIIHPVAGVQYMAGDVHLLLNGGYRMDRRDDDAGTSYGADQMAHADMSVAVPVAGPLHLELNGSFMDFQWGVNPIQQTDFQDYSASLALHIGSPWAVILYSDFSDNPLVRSTGNLGEDLYGAAELQWKPGSSTTLKAFAGAYRAGIRCAGGQCRYLPGFNGARLTLDTIF